MKKEIYLLTFCVLALFSFSTVLKAQNQVYWREGFEPDAGCDLTTTNPTAAVSYYFNGNAGVWYGNNVYRTTGTACASPFGANHVRYRNIAGVTDSGYLVTPIVNYGIQELHFTISRANRYYTVWQTPDTLATTTNWTIVAPHALRATTCTDSTIIVASSTAKRLKIVGRPLTDSDVDSFWVTSFFNLPVPLNLTSFNAVYDGHKVNLNWNTTNEVNTKHFEIERSIDGINYTAVGTVTAKNSPVNNNYIFADIFPLTGGSFYRLKMVDIDGRFKYSNVISINTKIRAGLSVYPSPAISNITVYHGKLNEDAIIKIIGTDGRMILSNKITAGVVQTAIDISKLTPGIYQVTVIDGVNKNSQRFIKQ